MSPALVVSVLWFGAVAWWIKGRTATWPYRLLLIPLAFLCVLMGAPGVWAAAQTGYPGDSFWTLRLFGRGGVVAISLIGFLVIFSLLSVLPNGLPQWPRPVRIAIGWGLGLAIYSVIYSLSPQAFYTFYQWIFAGLPQQIVVTSAFDLPRLMQVAALRPDGSLSDHLAGLGLWAVVPYTAWRHLMRR